MLITRATGPDWNGGYTWKTVWSANRFALVSLLAPSVFRVGLAIAAIGAMAWLTGRVTG